MLALCYRHDVLNSHVYDRDNCSHGQNLLVVSNAVRHKHNDITCSSIKSVVTEVRIKMSTTIIAECIL